MALKSASPAVKSIAWSSCKKGEVCLEPPSRRSDEVAMNELQAAGPALPSPAGEKRGRSWATVGIFFLPVAGVTIAVAAYWYWPARDRPAEIQMAPQEPPAISLVDVDKAIAAAIRAAEQSVRQRPASADAWGHLGLVF